MERTMMANLLRGRLIRGIGQQEVPGGLQSLQVIASGDDQQGVADFERKRREYTTDLEPPKDEAPDEPIVPPTAIIGRLTVDTIGMKEPYGKFLRACLVPAVLIILAGTLMVFFSDKLSFLTVF